MKLVDHPNVMRILDENVDYDPPYFVMPRALGSLADETSQLSQDHDAALAAFLQVCDGVEAVHAAVGPHRDLKPSNALRMSDGSVVVSDFGLIKIDPRDTTALTRTSVYMGTEGYMAPEQRRRGGTKNADNRVDVYALGAFLSELLTGEPPPPVDMSNVPPPLAHVITRAMAQLLSNRYATVAELAAAVRNVQRLRKAGKDPRRVVRDARKAATAAFVNADDWDHDATKLLLQAMRGLLPEPHGLRDEFDLIPIELLQAAAKTLPDALVDALDAYCSALDETVSGMAWSYAEDVADRMMAVMKRARRADVKANAVRATLIAAHDLGRFAALDTLAAMVLWIKQAETARAVADMFRREATRVAPHMERLKKGDPHPFVADVLDEIQTQADDESQD